MQTAFLIQGLNQKQLEGFAEYVADEQGCGWLVRRAPYSTGDTGYFQLGFSDQLCFRQEAAITRVLKSLGATTALSIHHWD